MRTRFLTAAAGLAAAAGSLGLGAAVAAPAGATSPATSTARATAHPVARQWLRDHRRQIVRDVLAVSAKTIGIPASELAGDLKAGSSIAAVASAHDVAPTTVVDALVTGAKAKVAKAVADHRITAATGARIDAALPDLFTRVVHRTFGHRTGTPSSTAGTAAS